MGVGLGATAVHPVRAEIGSSGWIADLRQSRAERLGRAESDHLVVSISRIRRLAGDAANPKGGKPVRCCGDATLRVHINSTVPWLFVILCAKVLPRRQASARRLLIETTPVKPTDVASFATNRQYRHDSHADRVAVASSPDWIDWNGANFLGPCQGDCSFALLGGRQITTAMTRIMLIHNAVPPWQWHWGDAGIIDGEFSRRLVTFWNALDIEPQIGIGKRFGDMHAAEFWGALAFRWTAFPWNNYVKTTVAISEGISLATQIDTVERDANPNRAGSMVLNYFSPEITVSLPNYKQYELVLCIHHRSGLYGLIDHVNAGSQFGTVGLRIHF